MNRVMFHYYIEPKVIPDFLTEDEIEYIKKESINKLEPSKVGDHAAISHDIRKSETAMIELHDPIIISVARKCAGLTNKPITHCEKLQVCRYKEGGHFSHHHDVGQKDIDSVRLYTFIIALNDYEGGETEFPELNVEYKLKKGDALFFHTLDNHETFTSLALHGGKPVKSAEKWICNLWVWSRPIPELHAVHTLKNLIPS